MHPGSAKRILIAPLDWGLGHTTRCIPIIRRLLELNCEVLFAGNDRQQTFIAGLFPRLEFRTLPGYNVAYSRHALPAAIARQVPRIIRTVRAEHEWLLQLVKRERIDGIISDNRYGLWHPQVPAVILTHQLQIRTGLGAGADGILRRLHYRFLRRFSGCWIVDAAGPGNLGGSLSHPEVGLPGAQYIGWTSQLSPPRPDVQERHLLVLLSGPEPQRTILSDLLWTRVCALETPVVFVEGSASASRDIIPAHIQYHPQVAGADLQRLLESAGMVICRSGYSTLMDLLLLRKKAILIPTPGQTEQEYLARTLQERGMFYSAPQAGFSLPHALEAAGRFPFILPETAGAHELYRVVLDAWIGRI